jgi:hypothetical protein
MNRLAGIAGSLFPLRYLADAIDRDVPPVPADWLRVKQQRFLRWWNAVSRTCGPATGLRALFDLVAMPLFGMLGFRARDAAFDRQQARAWLATRQGTPVGLVLLPWADRPSALWRDVASAARDVGAAWAFLLAPPYLTLVDARGHAARREIEFTLPEALEPASFARLWWLTRAAAFDQAAAESASWLDTLVWRAAAYQDRVREDLQHGVAEALACLTAAIAPGHRSTSPAAPPRQMLRDAPVSAFDEALTIVYRILFLLFAESRELVPVRAPIYARGYAVGALGREARREDATGLWEGLAAITRLSRIGCHTGDLIVQPFNGSLFSRRAAPSLEAGPRGTRRARRGLALDGAAGRALGALVSREGPGGREDISYADLGVEQLGSVYERVLDLAQPGGGPARQDLPVARAVRGRHSARRKQTGTFYTPRALAEFLVRRTLAPLVAGASADAILRLRVVDPAMGSGAFLVAACRFLASAYERALIDEGRIAPADLDEEERADIRRLIAERCLAGVDCNPTAVQLARLSLWLATLAHGKPLTFLDHRLRTGDSLVGASPADLARTPGRRPAAAALPLFDQARLEESLRNAAVPLLGMAARRDDTVTDVRAKEALWRELTSPVSPLAVWRRAATLWCARWFWPAGEPAPNPAEWRALFDALLRGDATLPTAHLTRRLTVAEAVGERLRFFHWPLEFTDLFYDRPRPRPVRPGIGVVSRMRSRPRQSLSALR